MDSPAYSIPAGVHKVSEELLDIRSDAEIDHDLLNPKPITDDKNVWFFWHSGYSHMHGYTQRNIRAWHRRFSKQGWTMRVLDRVPSSHLNVAEFLDVSDLNTFPIAFVNGAIGGDYGVQHTSDLVRFPLLLKYGGVYADVGLMQIGDLDRMWNETIGNPNSRFEVLSYNCGGVEDRVLANHFLVTKRNNPYFERCHRLLLHLWNEDGGKTSTEGMHSHPLLKGVPMMGQGLTWTEGDRTFSPEEGSKMLTDYIIQGQVLSLVQGLVDVDGDWNGLEYTAEHIYAIEYMEGAQLINEVTAWNGPRAFELMSFPLPKDGEAETEDQKLARDIVEACLRRSFGFKLAHGMIVRVLGDTLGSLWRKHTGSDNIPGTYAHWLRQGMIYWCPDNLPPALEFTVMPPFRTGPLLSEQ